MKEQWGDVLNERSRRWRNGFSLIELVVVIVVLSIVGTMTIRYVASAGQFYVTILAKRQADSEAFFVLDRMRREVRLLKSILVADAGEFSFVNQVAVTNTFRLNTADATLNGNMLATNVNTFVFSYYDSTNGALTSLPLNPANRALVRRVSLSLRITKGAQSSDLNADFFYPQEGILE